MVCTVCGFELGVSGLGFGLLCWAGIGVYVGKVKICNRA